MVTVILFTVMLVLFFFSMPIPASLGIAGLAAITELGRASPEVLIQRMFYGLDSFLILAVPLFILLGDLMVASRITDRLVDFAMALVGRFRGGLGHVSILANMLISGISGSGTADAAATGAVLVPAMEKAGYRRPLAAAIIGASATAGPIIPPSIFMIIYASLAGESVARMFIAGLAPGVIMGVAMMVLVAWMARRYEHAARREGPASRSAVEDPPRAGRAGHAGPRRRRHSRRRLHRHGIGRRWRSSMRSSSGACGSATSRCKS